LIQSHPSGQLVSHVAVAVLVAVFVGVSVGVPVGVDVGVLVGVFVGVRVGVSVGVLAGVDVACVHRLFRQTSPEAQQRSPQANSGSGQVQRRRPRASGSPQISEQH
jgi:hypothetical protein